MSEMVLLMGVVEHNHLLNKDRYSLDRIVIVVVVSRGKIRTVNCMENAIGTRRCLTSYELHTRFHIFMCEGEIDSLDVILEDIYGSPELTTHCNCRARRYSIPDILS